jgi:Ser/Thr protein kinase RdoA (MazF antagonist)
MTKETCSNSCLRAVYATPLAESVAELVRARYELGEIETCQFLNRGFNDTFGLRAGGRGYVARLSGRRRRGEADVATETAFLAYLDVAGVPVAAAVPTREGALFTEPTAPEGPRPMVLFHHAKGRPPVPYALQDARAQGVTLARIHQAAETFPGREDGRYRLDLEHLLHRPLGIVSDLSHVTAATREYLVGLASRLANSVAALDGPTLTRCHGDCHGGNARIEAGTAVFFDFDDGGYGYLAYDLAVYLWAQVSFGRSRYGMWDAFLRGYRSVRDVKPVDLDSTRLFVAIRHIWLLGEYAGRITQWGSDNVPASFFDQQADFLRAWEADQLSPSLL